MIKILKSLLFFLLGLSFLILIFLVILRPSTLFKGIPPVTKGSFNHDSDPINVAFVGNKDAITKVFLAAHWLLPDIITSSTSAKIAKASLLNISYPTAPMSNLHLFGRVQDLSFELPTNTVRQRHHVRLWGTTKLVSGKPLWVGSSSYDSGIELSHVDAFPTHHISPNVDAERGFLSRSLEGTGLIQKLTIKRINYPTFWGFNSEGDWYFDDGLVNILYLN